MGELSGAQARFMASVAGKAVIESPPPTLLVKDFPSPDTFQGRDVDPTSLLLDGRHIKSSN